MDKSKVIKKSRALSCIKERTVAPRAFSARVIHACIRSTPTLRAEENLLNFYRFAHIYTSVYTLNKKYKNGKNTTHKIVKKEGNFFIIFLCYL